jgi:hypothetical protein
MKGYQMEFGVVDWNDDDDMDNTNDQDSFVSNPSHRRQRKNAGSATLSSIDTAAFKQEDQTRRIQRVRNRYKVQNQALSIWWKIAIQANVQQRMWMQLGSSPVESLLPPRFERLYQPEKMAQFDRFFARSWATPVRRSHSAQHSGDSDDENEVAEFRRNTTGRLLGEPSEKTVGRSQETAGDTANQQNDDGASLEQFVGDYGFEPHKEPSLKMFVERHGMIDRQIKPSDTGLSGTL